MEHPDPWVDDLEHRHRRDKARIASLIEALEESEKGIGSMLWVMNNTQNAGTALFAEMVAAAQQDGRAALATARAALASQEGDPTGPDTFTVAPGWEVAAPPDPTGTPDEGADQFCPACGTRWAMPDHIEVWYTNDDKPKLECSRLLAAPDPTGTEP